MIGENSPVSNTEALAQLLADAVRRIAELERSANRTNALPGGVVSMTVAASAPAGWALLNGQTLTGAQTSYPQLWAAAPTGWRSGANLVLPDYRGKFPIMVDGSHAIGTTGGSLTKTIATGNLPSHTHTGTTGTESADHAHSGTTSGQSNNHVHGEAIGQAIVGSGGTSYVQFTATVGFGIQAQGVTAAANVDHSHTITTGGRSAAHTHSFTSDATGSGTALDITPAYAALNFMVRLR